MSSFVDRCIFLPASGGTGTWTVSAAVTGYLTPAQANALNATLYSYAAELRDANNNVTAWEVGTGTYTVSGTTLSRTPIFSSNSNAAVNFASPPNVMICVLAEDMLALHANSLSLPAAGTIDWNTSEFSLARNGANVLGLNTAYMDIHSPGTSIAEVSVSGDNPNTGSFASGLWQLRVAGTVRAQFNVQRIGTGNGGQLLIETGDSSNAQQICAQFNSDQSVQFFTGAGAAVSFATDTNGNVIVGNAAIATNATNGFFYVETCAGTPTGTPTSETGRVPMIFDTTNSQFWIYTGGAWKQPRNPAAGAIITWQ